MPLILPSQRLIRPNPLAYPAGATPGFDRSHPAASGNACFLSTVCIGGGGFIDLLQGFQSSLVSTPAFTVDGQIGPGVVTTNATLQAVTVPYRSLGTVTQFTGAAIGKFHAVTDNVGYLFTVDGPGLNGIGKDKASGTFDFTAFGGDTFPGGGITAIDDVPYFVAYSSNLSSINWVIRRLDTGQTRTGIEAVSFTSVAPTGPAYIGNRGAARSANAPVAAVMSSLNFLSPSQLLAWAADPWSFWYPRSMQSLFTQADTPVVTTQYAAFSIPQHSLSQLANRMIGY